MWCVHVWLFLLLLYDHFWSHFAHSCEFIEINWLWWKAQTWGSYHHQPWATKAYGSWLSIKIRIGHYLWHACWMVLMFSSCVLFLLFIQVFVKCQASSYEKACTRIRRWAHLGLCPHIENAQRECAITITFDLHSIPLHSHKFSCMLIVKCQDSSQQLLLSTISCNLAHRYLVNMSIDVSTSCTIWISLLSCQPTCCYNVHKCKMVMNTIWQTSMNVAMHIEKCELNINLFTQILCGQLNNTICVLSMMKYDFLTFDLFYTLYLTFMWHIEFHVEILCYV